MKCKKLLAIYGSPRSHGITAAMLDCAVQTAQKAGWTVDKINLYDMQISYCTGCRACIHTGNCVQKDDIQEIAAMEETNTFPKPRLSSSQKYILLTACNTPAPFSWICGQSRGAGHKKPLTMHYSINKCVQGYDMGLKPYHIPGHAYLLSTEF